MNISSPPTLLPHSVLFFLPLCGMMRPTQGCNLNATKVWDRNTNLITILNIALQILIIIRTVVVPSIQLLYTPWHAKQIPILRHPLSNHWNVS